ncbi:hypothetical protein I5677_07850 [Mobilitalea sibirica]|uniref:Bacterial Ig domain-containing protein n=1 Tax=Mobilitalea sibirica TaxID=1462919 RepID=A0A8J7H282_9FIRM|nr:Ig-like domain-containing protein [Mobilitalea sibirica]MBH1940798.1 hypothetical protein [Mobilitalea sibirica]
MRQKYAFLWAVILMAGGFFGSNTVAKAYEDLTNKNLTLTRVADIDVYNDYIINELMIDTVQQDQRDGLQVYKINLEQDGYISLLLTARNVTKTVETYGSRGFSSDTSDATLTATVYRDSKLLYPVVPQIIAKSGNKAESAQKIALDQGTYYIAIQTDKYSNWYGGTSNTGVWVKGVAEFIIYYQPVNSKEVYRPSTVGKENPVTIEKEFVGLLTATNPKDYYKFELEDKALVKINYMYGSTKNAKFILYSQEREELIAKTVAGNSVWYNVEKFLEPGTYYCSLETVTPNDGGLTNLLITQTVYPLRLTKKNKDVNTYVTVSTIDAPKEIRYVIGKLTNSELTSSKWKNGKIITEDFRFGVNKIGYYTVRVTDEYGNMFMQSIKVTSCDKKAPSRPVIKSSKAGNYVITGTAEKNSLVTVTVNRRSYTCMASSKGNFKCEISGKLIKGQTIEVTAQDISGNISIKAEATVE